MTDKEQPEKNQPGKDQPYKDQPVTERPVLAAPRRRPVAAGSKNVSGRNDKKKRSFWRRHLDLLLVAVIFVPFYYVYILTQPPSPFLPRTASMAPYTRHIAYSVHPPFVSSYFLMLPQNYQPEKYRYPLIMMLHGASAHMYAGQVLMRPVMRARVPAIVLIPVAPFGFVWDGSVQGMPKPGALPHAMSALDQVMQNYSVDAHKIYVTGYSMGGIGTYAALARYPDVFAAAAPMDGHWPLSRLSDLPAVPLWIFHGAQDQSMPVHNSRKIAQLLEKAGRPVYYTEYPDYGHGAWVPSYDNPDFWAWLLQQAR